MSSSSSMGPSALDLALFHRNERDLYEHLVHILGRDTEKTKWVIALWLWFESIGHHDFIHHVKSYTDMIVLRFVDEAERCVECLFTGQVKFLRREIPLNSALLSGEPIDLGFFVYQRDLVFPEVRKIFKNVCQVIFDDKLMQVIAREMDHPASKSVMSSGLIISPFGEGPSDAVAPLVQFPVPSASEMARLAAAAAAIRASFLRAAGAKSVVALNPEARPWSPEWNSGPDCMRSMFITFSRGFPISREDIEDFFSERFGKCVEAVMIERVPPGAAPMYGRIVFKSASIIALVLNGQRTAKFFIKGRHLWARMYIPRKV